MSRETKCPVKRETKAKQPAQQPRHPPHPRDSFQVVIQCDSEQEQEQLYNEFRSRDLTVRLLTM